MKCIEIMKLADDFGDNDITFHCELEKGHKGKHKESGINDYGESYIVEWLKKEVKENEKE